MKMVDVPNCPVCGGHGSLAHSDCIDQYMGIPGVWSYRRCAVCESLWMSPRPDESEIPKLYGNYYTHSKPKSALEVPLNLRLGIHRLLANLLSLQRCWGYKITSLAKSSLSTTWLGSLLTIIPGSRMRSGAIVRYVSNHPDGHLLDVGCGNGGFLLTMRDLGWHVEGLEPDLDAVRSARALGLEVSHGLARASEIPPKSWDAITMNHVIEHVVDPRSTIELLTTKLNEDGLFSIISPNPVGSLAHLFGKNWFAMEPPRHLVLPSPKGYELMTGALGLKAEVFTSNSMAAVQFGYSLDYVRQGRITGSGHWGLSKLYGYFWAPIVKFLAPRSGEEVVCLIRRKR
jgi:SAM-dependent methyltransferase